MKMIVENGASRTLSLTFLFMVSALIVSNANAATWYVKAANYGQSGLDGRSEATAWGTLQDAHDNASAGDTILVYPGYYTQGGRAGTTTHTTNQNRLFVTKKLTFVSTVPKAAHIVGAHAATADGRGSGAVRCISVTTDGHGTIFKDFTIRDGATLSSGTDPLNTGGAGSTCSGGGLIVLGAHSDGENPSANVRKVYLVDCVISNCVATWGGAMHGGTAIRCLMADNTGSSFGQAACQAALWNTVIVRNNSLSSDRPMIGNFTIAVNCTFSFFDGVGADRSVYLYNCVFYDQASTEMSTKYKYDNNANYPSSYTSCYGKSNDVYPFISPATGDFRPRTGSPIVDGGVTSYLTGNIVLPEGTEMTDYNGNPLDLSKATCDAGAVQGAVAPKGGRLDFSSAGVEVNGFKNRRVSYSYATEWPTMVTIRPAETNFFRLRLEGFAANGSPFRYADYNGVVSMLYPPYDGTVTTVSSITYKYELWCSPNADAATADGTYEHPFRTLQAAMDCVAASQYASKETIVRALPGDYNEGSVRDFGHDNRVVLPADRPVLIKSTDGAEVTTIRGLADPDTLNDADYPGCGPNAMRCVVFGGGSENNSTSSRAIQGFTIADGHSNKADYTSDQTGDRVGGVYVGPYVYGAVACQILDCTFTNCAAVRGGALYGGWHSRCRYYDCHGYGGVMRYAYLTGCYVDPSCTLGGAPSDASKNTVLGTGTSAFLTTCPNADYGGSYYFNCLFGEQQINGSRFWGSIFKSATSFYGSPKGYTVVDPQYVDYAGGDYRVTRTSPAIGGAKLPEEGSGEWGLYVSNIWTFASTDVNTRPLRITDGKLMSGSDHEPVRGFYAIAEKGGVTLSGASMGFTELTDGLSVTVTAGNPGTRPCIGYTVNGVTNLFGEANGTVTAADANEDGLLVAALYSNDWYVNADPDIGDDAMTGFTAATPKRTLTAALANAISGDTVHAAAGTYAEGSRTPSGCTVAARAHVPNGVTLEGAGADATFIVGANATTNPDTYGLGTDAMRCVFLEGGARVKGFTLMGGRTNTGWSDTHAASADWHGAGVCGVGTITAISVAEPAEAVAAMRVEDCIVSNCMALCGGAGYNVTFVGCRLFKCRAQRGSATERCGLVNTIVDDMDSSGGSGICVNNSYPIVNTTIGPNIRKDSGGNGAALYYQSNLFPNEYGVVNSVILGSVSMVTALTNCVFTTGTVSGTMVATRKLTAAQIALDANYRPNRATSALVDQGTDTVDYGETDIYGGQRVYNGTVDIGAVEADWRGRYAADISGKGAFEVTAASPDVEEVAGVVQMPAGASLDAAWTGDGSGTRSYTVTLRLAADSAATVRLNGETLAVCDTEGLHELKFYNPLALNALTFSCTSGTAEILSSARIFGTTIVFR